MTKPALQILLGAAEGVISELSDIPLACCNGGVPMVEWLDTLRSRLKHACTSAAEADRGLAHAEPIRAAVPNRRVLLDRRPRRH